MTDAENRQANNGEGHSRSDGGSRHGGFTRRALTVIGLVIAAVTLLMFLWYAVDVLLLIFAGVLLAVFLRGLSDWVSRHTPLPGGWALAAVILALIGVVAAGAWLIAPDVAAVDSVALELISRSTCMFFVIAPATPACSRDELEMLCTRLAIWCDTCSISSSAAPAFSASSAPPTTSVVLRSIDMTASLVSD